MSQPHSRSRHMVEANGRDAVGLQAQGSGAWYKLLSTGLSTTLQLVGLAAWLAYSARAARTSRTTAASLGVDLPSVDNFQLTMITTALSYTAVSLAMACVAVQTTVLGRWRAAHNGGGRGSSSRSNQGLQRSSGGGCNPAGAHGSTSSVDFDSGREPCTMQQHFCCVCCNVLFYVFILWMLLAVAGYTRWMQTAYSVGEGVSWLMTGGPEGDSSRRAQAGVQNSAELGTAAAAAAAALAVARQSSSAVGTATGSSADGLTITAASAQNGRRLRMSLPELQRPVSSGGESRPYATSMQQQQQQQQQQQLRRSLLLADAVNSHGKLAGGGPDGSLQADVGTYTSSGAAHDGAGVPQATAEVCPPTCLDLSLLGAMRSSTCVCSRAQLEWLQDQAAATYNSLAQGLLCLLLMYSAGTVSLISTSSLLTCTSRELDLLLADAAAERAAAEDAVQAVEAGAAAGERTCGRGVGGGGGDGGSRGRKAL